MYLISRPTLRSLGIAMLVALLMVGANKASAEQCPRLISESPTRVLIEVPGLGAKAQVRLDGEKSAALIRVEEAFEATNDTGTYFHKKQLATVSAKVAGSVPSDLVLHAFIGAAGELRWMLSYQKGSEAVTISNLDGTSRCEHSSALQRIESADLPAGFETVSAQTSATPAKLVYGKLFGS